MKQTIVQFNSQNKFPNDSDGTTRNLDRGPKCTLGRGTGGLIFSRIFQGPSVVQCPGIRRT